MRQSAHEVKKGVLLQARTAHSPLVVFNQGLYCGSGLVPLAQVPECSTCGASHATL